MQKKILKAGLFGHPVGKTLSPAIFGVFAELTGVPISYEPRDCEPDLLETAIIQARGAGWAGFNVTIPYKAAIMPLLHLCDPAAKAAGAVNCVRFGRAGVEGMNTDARALLEALAERQFTVTGKSAAIFGAGGSAASSGWALGRSRAAAVIFRARDNAAAANLAARLSRAFPETSYGYAPFETPAERPDIVVNATPLGMYQDGRPPCDPGPGTLCVDLPYKPGGTGFTKAAAAAGAPVIDGLTLLLWQAVLSLRFWSGLPTGDIVKFKGGALQRLAREFQGEK